MTSNLDTEDTQNNMTENLEIKMLAIINETDSFKNNSGPWWMFWKRRRHILAALVFFGFFNAYCLRSNLSVTIVAMTANASTVNGNYSEHSPTFNWSSKYRGIVLGSFFYGYVVTQIPGGWLASKWGGKLLFGWGVAFTAILTLLTPTAAYYDVHLLVALRMLEGFLEGPAHPAVIFLWSKWAPPLERGRLVNFGLCGGCIGTAVSLPLSGVIADRVGWQAVFYVTGCMGIIWFLFFITIVKENPKDDPAISSEELRYIEESLGTTRSNKTTINHPWKSILTSMPAWAAIVGVLVDSWGFYTLMTQLPTFMKDTMGYAPEKSGLISFVPFTVLTVVLYLQGGVSDWLERNGILTKGKIRKMFVCGAFIAQSVFIFLSGFLNTIIGILICITVGVGIEGIAWGTLNVNALEISPNDSGVIMGIALTLAVCSGIISPILVGFIVQNKSAQEWQYVFYITSGVYIFGAVFYGIFGSAERQKWAKVCDVPDTDESVQKCALLNDKASKIS